MTTISDMVGDSTSSCYSRAYAFASSAYTYVRDLQTKAVAAIGMRIMRTFYFPLNSDPVKQKQLKEEQEHFRAFWYGKELDSGYREHAMIKQKFSPPKELTFRVNSILNQPLVVTCNVIESRNVSDALDDRPIINGFYVAGNHSTIDTPTKHVLPLLTSCNKKDYPQRLFIFSFYNINYAGKKYELVSVGEMGLVLDQVMQAISYEYGRLSYSVDHSVGAIGMVAAMEYILKSRQDPSAFFPGFICLHNAPSAIWQVSRQIGVVGLAVYPLAYVTGCTLNLGSTVAQFVYRHGQHVGLAVVNVTQDHRFSNDCSLYHTKEIERLQKSGEIFAVMFNWAQHENHEAGHHSLDLGECHYQKQVPDEAHKSLVHPRQKRVAGEPMLLPGENVTDALIRKVLFKDKERKKQVA